MNNLAVLLIEEECEAPSMTTVKVKPAKCADQIEEALKAVEEIRDRVTMIKLITTDGEEPFCMHTAEFDLPRL